jgi:hypothetical protein
MTSQSGARQSYDPELRDSSEDSGSAKGRLAGNLQINHASRGSCLHDVRKQATWETDVLQYIAVDDEVSFALGWIGSRGHSVYSGNAGNVVDECCCTVDKPAHQIATVSAIIKDASNLPPADVLAKNRSKYRAATFVSSM